MIVSLAMFAGSDLCARDFTSVLRATRPFALIARSNDAGAIVARLTHIDAKGRARMVDVSRKAVTARVARAGCRVAMREATLDQILAGGVPKGDVLAVARLAVTLSPRTGWLSTVSSNVWYSASRVGISPFRNRSENAIRAFALR